MPLVWSVSLTIFTTDTPYLTLMAYLEIWLNFIRVEKLFAMFTIIHTWWFCGHSILWFFYMFLLRVFSILAIQFILLIRLYHSIWLWQYCHPLRVLHSYTIITISARSISMTELKQIIDFSALFAHQSVVPSPWHLDAIDYWLVQTMVL